MHQSEPYVLIDVASGEMPIPGADVQRTTEVRIPNVLTREQQVGKFYHGCSSKSLLANFYTCLEATAKSLIKHRIFNFTIASPHIIL